jgi:spore coat protein H
VGPPIDVTLPDIELELAEPDVPDALDDLGEVDAPYIGIPLGAEIPRVNVEISRANLNALHRNVRAEVEVPVSIEFDGVYYSDCEIEIHGGFARSLPKLSYRIRFDDSTLLETTLFSEEPEEHQRIVLQASGIDPTFIRNCLTLDLVRELGGMAPRCSYVEFLFNGRYQGLYVAIERVDEHFLVRNNLTEDGLVLKASTNSANWADKENPLDGFEVKLNMDASTDAIGALLEALSETPMDFESYRAQIEPLLSLDDFTTWQLAHTLADNRDTFRKNYYLHYDWVGGQTPFRIISWDADATWGLSWDGGFVDPGAKRDLWGRDFFSPSLFSIPEYLEPYVARYQALLEFGNIDDWLYENIDTRTERIQEAAERDREAWAREDPFLDEIDFLNAAVDLRLDTMRLAFE